MDYSNLLQKKGLTPLYITEFLNAFNDNVYKTVVSLLIISYGDTGGLLSISAAMFIVPFIMFAGYAGYFADRYSKRSVIITAKAFEILVTCLATYIFFWNNPYLLIFILFLLATQATFFSPAKYGFLPEVLPSGALSRANGLLELTTFTAIIFGTAFGGLLLYWWKHNLFMIGLSVLGISIAGFISSLGVTDCPAANARKRFNPLPWRELRYGFLRASTDKVLLLSIIALAYFWGLGMASQLTIFVFGIQTLGLGDAGTAILNAVLGLGVGLGGMLAGTLSGDKIEYGLIPLGALGMAAGIFSLAFASPSLTQVYISLIVIGVFSGFYIVPLQAIIQDRPRRKERGRIIAVSVFCDASAMLIASFLVWVLRVYCGLTPIGLFVVYGCLTFAVGIAVVKIMPEFFIRLLLWILTHTFYKVRLIGAENIPKRGPALLVCNHVSYLDGVILSASVPRFLRYIIWRKFYEAKSLNWLFKMAHAIPTDPADTDKQSDIIQRARQELKNGHIVCIFAEGKITRTGAILPFRSGLERIMQGLDNVPIIPAHLDQISESIFAYRGGKVFWRLPSKIPVRAVISFGQLMPGTTKAAEVRQAVQELSASAMRTSIDRWSLLSVRFFKAAKRRPLAACLQDANKKAMNYSQVMLNVLLMSKRLYVKNTVESYVAVLLPPSVNAALINMALITAGRQVINLPYDQSITVWDNIITQAHISTIITSRDFIAQLGIEPLTTMLFIEDLDFEFTRKEKILALVAAITLPACYLQRIYGEPKIRPESTVIVTFTRGTTGYMKGVMLSHRNILANVIGFSRIFHLSRKDRILAILPLHTAYGFSGTLVLPLLVGMCIVFPSYPQDWEQIADLMVRYHITMLMGTTEAYAEILETIRPSQMGSVKFPIVGGSAVSAKLYADFKQRFDLDLLESYGCTEMGPAISVSRPNYRGRGQLQRGLKPGSVGQPLPGVAIKIVDPNTFAERALGEPGLLLVKGLGRMEGYFNEPQHSAAVFRDEWYVTGDLASVDEDGFLFLHGRCE